MITMGTMSYVRRTNGNLERLSPKELASLTRAPTAKTTDEKRENLARATRGLRVEIHVTPALYGRR
jgi:hypothetical protein